MIRTRSTWISRNMPSVPGRLPRCASSKSVHAYYMLMGFLARRGSESEVRVFRGIDFTISHRDIQTTQVSGRRAVLDS